MMNNDFNLPPTANTTDWFSTGRSQVENDIGSYCAFCFTNFKKYYPLHQNICSSCGRVAPQVLENRSDRMRVRGLNESRSEIREAISVEIDYNDSLRDETTNGIPSSGRMSANSIGEAMRMLHEAETKGSRRRGSLYSIRIKSDEKMARLDTNSSEDGQFQQ